MDDARNGSPPGPSPRPKGSPTWGAATSLLAISKQISDSTSSGWASSRSKRANGIGVRLPFTGQWWRNQIPLRERYRGTRGMPVPHSNVISNLYSCRWLGMEPNRVIKPDCGHIHLMCNSQHLFT